MCAVTRLCGRPRVTGEARARFWVSWVDGVPTRRAAVAAGFSEGAAWKLVKAHGGIAPRATPAPSGRYLSLTEREQIYELQVAGTSVREIAVALERSPSTISRELRRHSDYRGRYSPHAAQRCAERSALRPKPAKLAVEGELRTVVSQLLRRRYSPEQIAGRLRKDHPDRPEMWVSHETIYQSLYVQGRGGLRRELATRLRTGRTLRKPAKRSDGRRARIPGMVNIADRPAEVADRAVPGHWEGDLIIGARSGSAIGTLVERSTRFVMLLHLPDGHTAEAVEQEMIRQVRRLPAHVMRSITWDQGVEMARHAQFTVATDVPVYFCDPHSPWQRGTNENTNGLLRQYFPKGTDLSAHTADELDRVADELNERPRKTLLWNTPAEQLNELLVATTG